MSAHVLCQRCQELPVRPRARGSLCRCPLCAAPLIKSGDATFRADATAFDVSNTWARVVPMILGTLAALLVVGALIAAICLATLRTIEHSRLITSARITQNDADWSAFNAPPKPPPVQPALVEMYVLRPVQPAAISPRPQSAAPSAAKTPAMQIAAPPASPIAAEQRFSARIWLKQRSEQDLRALLDQVTEVALFDQPARSDRPHEPEKVDKAHRLIPPQYVRIRRDPATEPPVDQNAQQPISHAKLAKDHRAQLQALVEKKDALIDHLIKTRESLSGLPFLLGKDCQLEKSKAEHLQEHSIAMRSLLTDSQQRPNSLSTQHFTPTAKFGDGLAMAVSHTMTNAPAKQLGAGVPAYHQILSGENTALRMALVDGLAAVKGNDAVRRLANRAVFDASPEVRAHAVEALKKADAAIYADDILAALRYPFAPVANHAAEALVHLKLTSTVPQLVRWLDEPEVDEPVLKKVEGRQTYVRREMVRINHLRNCVLCHAPDTTVDRRDRRGLPTAPIPILGTRLPPRVSPEYYSGNSGGILVRADITYLRQDFSALQLVRDADPWPSEQRFDFLVRERELTSVELDEWQQRERQAEQPMSDHRRALIYALQGLSGEMLGDNSRAWRLYFARR